MEDNHEHFHEAPPSRFERRAPCQEDEPTDEPLITWKRFLIVAALAVAIVAVIALTEVFIFG